MSKHTDFLPLLLNPSAPVSLMIHQKIRLVLKTAHKTHGYKKALRASLIETQHIVFLTTSEFVDAVADLILLDHRA